MARSEAFSEGDASELDLPELDALLDHNAKIYRFYMRPGASRTQRVVFLSRQSRF
jgi:hypothetical protein